jgi:hypothetical protein
MRLAVAPFNPIPPPTVAGGTAHELSCMWAPSVARAWLWTIMRAVAILPSLHVAGKYSAVCKCACLRVRVRACKRGLYGHSCSTAATGGIYSSACNGRTDTCAFALAIGRSPTWPQVPAGHS